MNVCIIAMHNVNVTFIFLSLGDEGISMPAIDSQNWSRPMPVCCTKHQTPKTPVCPSNPFQLDSQMCCNHKNKNSVTIM